MSYHTSNFQMLHFIYYSTNIRTEYFKHAANSPFFSLQNAVHNATFFGSCVIHILYAGCAKIKKKKKIWRQRVKVMENKKCKNVKSGFTLYILLEVRIVECLYCVNFL